MSATARGTPLLTRPWATAKGSALESPMIMSVKKMPMDSTWPAYRNVAFMPDPAPRCSAGRLFITPALFGAANAPIASPFISKTGANTA